MKVTIVLALLLVANQILAHPPSGIVVDEKGRVFFQDGKEGLWRVEDNGKLTLVNKVAWHWLAADVDGKFAQADDEFGEWFSRLTPKREKPALIACSDFPCVIR